MTPKFQENPQMSSLEVTEQKRPNEAREKGIPWKKWGPYLSERQWGKKPRPNTPSYSNC